MNVAGGAILFLAIQTIIYTILAVLCELKAFTFWLKWVTSPVHDAPRTEPEDDVVLKETDNVHD